MSTQDNDVTPDSELRRELLSRRLLEAQSNSMSMRGIEKAQAMLTQPAQPSAEGSSELFAHGGPEPSGQGEAPKPER